MAKKKETPKKVSWEDIIKTSVSGNPKPKPKAPKKPKK
jgi:hypothetical protein